MKFFHELGKKPPEVRAQYAFSFSVGITVFIALVWVTTVPARFADLDADTEKVKVEGSSLDTIIDETKDQLGNIISAQRKIDEAISEGVSDVPVESTIDTAAMDSLGSGIENSVAASGTSPSVLDMMAASTGPRLVPEEQPIPTPAPQPTEPKTPKVILISTTTSQKPE